MTEFGETPSPIVAEYGGAMVEYAQKYPIICKPQARAFQKALQFAGETDFSKCILFDDSRSNVKAAKQLGMFAVLIQEQQPAHSSSSSSSLPPPLSQKKNNPQPSQMTLDIPVPRQDEQLSIPPQISLRPEGHPAIVSPAEASQSISTSSLQNYSQQQQQQQQQQHTYPKSPAVGQVGNDWDVTMQYIDGIREFLPELFVRNQ